MQGWIKLHRDLMEKPIWLESTPEQKTVLLTLLMMANHKEKQWEWQGKPYKVEPGQFITSLESIARKCGKGVSIQNVRTSLRRFEKSGFLTNESTNKNRLITIINWDFYQDNDTELTNNLTGSQQAANKQLTTNKNVKKEKNEKEKIPYVEIINYLNEKAGKRFSSTSEAHKKFIRGRFNDGRTLEDFKHVIDVKCEQWLNNSKMVEYLRPSTLFAPKNFENYLNEGSNKEAKRATSLLDREIAFNRAMNDWLNAGNNPEDFVWTNEE